MAAASQKAGIWFDQVWFFESDLMQLYVTKKTKQTMIYMTNFTKPELCGSFLPFFPKMKPLSTHILCDCSDRSHSQVSKVKCVVLC